MEKRILITVAALVLAAWGGAPAQEPAAHKRPSPDRIQQFERQEFRVADFDAKGYVLDIGGGGEGIIGQMKPAQVIAIDLVKRELEEAPAGPLKIVMDARDLKFLDGSFQTATAFFSLMYITAEADQEKVFREVYRVLAPGGRFLIWDVDLPARAELNKDVAVFRFNFHLPGKDVKTGYGTYTPERRRGLAHFAALAEKTGFQVLSKQAEGHVAMLTLSR